MGTICGAVSGDLEMFELEGRFVEKYTISDFKQRMKDAGLELLLARLTNGIITQSPSGGWHFLYRITDGQADGNTKLAGTAESLTLIETRGEGGFVMLPPSHGATHPSGKPWTLHKGGYGSIPSITSDEREALFDVARSYDESPDVKPITPVTPGQRVTHQHYTAGEYRDSWIAMVEEHLRATWDMQQLLERYGWSFLYQDRHGRQLMHRPGKDGDGVGGSINLSDRFHPFSSSTPFPGASAGKKAPTWDRVGVIATYEYGGDSMAALNEIARTTGILQAWQQARDAKQVREMDALTNPQPQEETRGVNTTTGEVGAPSHDDLWEEREVFRHIRDAARSRLVSPYAVLGCVLARVAAFTPPTLVLPPLVGGTAPLSLYIALHGASGDGKSSPVECAASLIPHVPAGCRGPLPIGSGEGFIEAFIERTEEKDENNKIKRGFKQVAHGILYELDEGEFLTDVGNRKGSTILPILRSAWSGKEIGQTNASADTKRHLVAKRYSIGLVSLWQDDAGLNLLADSVGGTPQRFVWIPTADRTLTRELIPWPGPLDWEPPTINRMGDTWFHQEIPVPPEIVTQVHNHRWDVLQRLVDPNPLDSHRNLNKLKLSGILAVLDGRREITLDDWRIAERIMCISDAVRDTLVERGKTQAVERVRVDAVKQTFKEAILEQSATDRALKNAARAAWKCASSAPDGATRRDISRRIASRDRALVSVDDAIAHAISLEWLEGSDALNYRPGTSQPT
jgi:hypothetical protein